MKRGFLIFVAIVSILYGIGNLFAPAWINEIHGISRSPGTSLLSRYFGATLLGVGVMAWLARNAADSDALRAFLCGGLVIAVAGLIVSLNAMLVGVMNALGWMPVIVQAVFSLGFFRFACLRRPTD